MPKESKTFKDYSNPNGPYYETAVDRVEPAINNLPASMHAFETLDNALKSRKSFLYNDIEDYRGKRAKGSMLAIYRYIDTLRQSITQNADIEDKKIPEEVLQGLQIKIEEMLCAEISELLVGFREIVGNIKADFTEWQKIVTADYDTDKVLRIYQTAYLTFKMLQLKFGETAVSMIAKLKGVNINDVQTDLTSMMDLLKEAAKDLLKQKKAKEDAEQKALEEAERQDKEAEQKQGICAELDGAIKRAKHHVIEARQAAEKAVRPRLIKAEVLIRLFDALAKHDELQTFWRDFSDKSLSDKLMDIFDLPPPQREAWEKTFEYNCSSGVTSSLLYSFDFQAENINETKLENHAIAASNRLLNGMFDCRVVANMALKVFKNKVDDKSYFSKYHTFKKRLDGLDETIHALPSEIAKLSICPTPDGVLSKKLEISDGEINEDARGLFKQMMEEIGNARARFEDQQGHLKKVLELVQSLRESIVALESPFNDELIEKYHRLVKHLYKKVFDAEPECGESDVLDLLSTVYTQILSQLKSIEEDKKALATTLNNTLAENRITVLNQFITERAKSPWHWLFYLISKTYRKCYQSIKEQLNAPSESEPAVSIIKTLNLTLMSQLTQFGHFSPGKTFIRKVEQRCSGTFFTITEENEETGMHHAESKLALVLSQ